MKLKKLTLKNFRCFEELEIDFHNKMTIIVGNNGTGKTSIMEGAAIAIGSMFEGYDGLSGLKINSTDAHLKAYSIGSITDVQAQFPVEVVAEGENNGEDVEWKRSLEGEKGSTTKRGIRALNMISRGYQDRLRLGDESLILPILAYYSTRRLWNYQKERKLDTVKVNTRTNGYVDSMDGTADLKMMLGWFRNMTILKYQRQEQGNMEPIPELEAVLGAMEKCYRRITACQDVKMQYNLNTNEMDIFYTSKDGMKMRIPLSHMSDGYKSTISLIADIAYRMAVLNPQLLGDAVKKTDGIVLIDEIDLHLHPAWQQRILDDLQEIFPEVQFVVTTHAPAVIGCAKSENLAILQDDEIFGVESQIYGNDTNSILNEIMGVTERNPEVAGMFERFHELLNEKQFDEAEEILGKIDEKRGFHDKEVASSRVKLKMERIRGGRL